MASTFTANKNIELPGHGDYVDTWDMPVNADFTAVDTALGGLTSLNVTAVSGAVVLTSTQYRPVFVAISGTLTANVTYQVPSGVGGFWYVANNTTGNFTVTWDSGGAGTSVTVPQGYATAVGCDGTNAYYLNTAPVNPGGSTGQVQYNNAGVLAGSSNLTFTGGSTLGLTGTLNLTGGFSQTGNYNLTGTLFFLGSSSGYVAFTSPASAGSITYTLPANDGTNGQVLTTNGAHALSWTTVSGGGGVTSISFGSTGLTPSTATTGVVTVAGTLGVANGGTGATTLTSGSLLTGNGTGAVAFTSIPSGGLAGLTATQTLTNKNLPPRVTSVTSASSITPDGATTDIYEVTALATGLTINGTNGLQDGQPMLIRIRDNGTPRSLTWNAGYNPLGVSLPTTTVASTTLYVGFFWNSSTTAYDVVAVS